MQHKENTQGKNAKSNTTQKSNGATKELQELREEIQDLESQILDMFEVALHFAGLQHEFLQEALNYYMEVMESQDDMLPYTPQTIIANIMLIRRDKPQWFAPISQKGIQ